MSKPVSDSFNRKYKIIAKIGEGSYSEVLKCKNRVSGENYACKRLKFNYKNWQQVNEISEIVALRKLQRHPNILQMIEIHYDSGLSSVSLVFEIMDMNLYELIKERKRRLIGETRVRLFIFQLIRAIRHLHKNGIYHRDVKPENILLKNDLLKLGDLGSVRGIYSKSPYTEYISTRWYRSPECLLTSGRYNYKMDIWSVGCVFYEALTLRPLFPGQSEIDQISRIHEILGPPPKSLLEKFRKYLEDDRRYTKWSSRFKRHDELKKILSELKTNEESGPKEPAEVKKIIRTDGTTRFDWYFTHLAMQAKAKRRNVFEGILPQHISKEAKELMSILLNYDPQGRPSAHKALSNVYFKDLREQAHNTAKLRTISTDVPPSLPWVTIAGDDKLSDLAAKEMDSINLTTLGNPKGMHPGPTKTSHSRKELMDERIRSKQSVQDSTPSTSVSRLSKGIIKEEIKASRDEDLEARKARLELYLLKEMKPKKSFRIPTLEEKETTAKGVGDNASVDVLNKQTATMSMSKFNEDRVLKAAKLLSLKTQKFRDSSEFSTPCKSPSLDETQDLPVENKKSSRRSSVQILKPSMSLAKHKTSTVGIGKKKGHHTLKNKPSLTSLQTPSIKFKRKVVENLTPSAIKRINKTRKLVNLEPIGLNQEIKYESILNESESQIKNSNRKFTSQNNNQTETGDEEREVCSKYMANLFPSPKNLSSLLKPVFDKEYDSTTPLLTPIGSPKFKKQREKDINSNLKKNIDKFTEQLGLKKLYKSEILNTELMSEIFKKEVYKMNDKDEVGERSKVAFRHSTKKYPEFPIPPISKGGKTDRSRYSGRRITPKLSPFASPRKFPHLKRSPSGILKKKEDLSTIHRFRCKENRIPLPEVIPVPTQEKKREIGIKIYRLEEKATNKSLLKNPSPRQEYPLKTPLSYTRKSPYTPASTVQKLKSPNKEKPDASNKLSRIPVKKEEKPTANLAFPRNRFRDEPKIERF